MEKETKAAKAVRLYKESQEKRKEEIRREPKKSKRFWKWCWYFVSFPFRWIWANLHDWRTMVVFAIVFAIYSGSVWGFYLAAFLVGWTSELGLWLQGIGSAVWIWWLGPLSPFTELVIITTIGIKALFDKIKEKRNVEIRDGGNDRR